MSSAAEVALEMDVETPRVTLIAEVARLRAVIVATAEHLGRIHGAGQDVELLISMARDDLMAAIGETV